MTKYSAWPGKTQLEMREPSGEIQEGHQNSREKKSKKLGGDFLENVVLKVGENKPEQQDD